MEIATDPSTTCLVTAERPELIALDVFSEKAMSHFTVNFALLYPPEDRPSVTQLREALADVLTSHRHLAGRLVRMPGGVLAVACNGAGVPLTHLECPGTAAPSLEEPIADEHFDLVEDHMPGPESGDTGGPLIRLKVTDFADGQLIAICLNHLLCDARGMGEFMAAWSASFRGCLATHPRPSLGRAAVYPPTVAAYGGEPIGGPAEEVPSWRAAYMPAVCPEPRWGRWGLHVRFSP